jgi:hypothetical protein
MPIQTQKQPSASQPKRRRIAKARKRRGGGAAVEAAFCFPLIIFLMMGTLEVCAGIYLKESLTLCAYEGVRAGIHRRSTAEDVMDRVLEMLEDRLITIPEDSGGSPQGIEIIPSDFSGLNALDPITVRITAPTAGNSLYIFDSLVNRDVGVSVTMVREFDE